MRNLQVVLVLSISVCFQSCAVNRVGFLSRGEKQGQAARGADQPAGGQASWLARLNGYREAAGLRAVKENGSFSEGDFKHARYLVKNHVGFGAGAAAHSEDAANPWYSREGLEAAQTSDVIPPGGSAFDDEEAIDLWLSAPFHALPMLDPDLGEAGFGRYCENGQCAAALRVGRDESWFRNPAHSASLSRLDPERHLHDNPYVYELPVATHALASPIEFPPDGAVISAGSFDGNEWPDPLAPCAGYRPPTGPAITLQLGTEVNPEVTAHSFARDGERLEHCIYDASTYANPDAIQARSANGILKLMGVVVLIPREPLISGATYSVSITARGATHAWSFSVASRPPSVYKPAAR